MVRVRCHNQGNRMLANLGDITVGGSMVKIDHLANFLQVAKDAAFKALGVD
ncbi:hypothetical protein [Sporosarcina sp. FSL K6-3457]|uniref:hypothetical protein n=1 Tax=Sporosarcina sp. FSL K6-3457 TaxID=2978204 RepID=UPI0030F4F937